MPRLPDASALGERTIPVGRAPLVQDRSGEIAAAGLGQAAERIGSTVAAFAQRQDQLQYAKARSELLGADASIRKELEADNDWQTYEQRYREKLGKAREKVSAGIRGRSDRSLFEQETTADIERGAAAVRDLSRRKEVDVGRADLDLIMDANRRIALEAGDEALRNSLIASTQDAIHGAQNKGYITAQEAVARKQAWANNYALGALEIMPAAARMKVLEKPEGTVAAYLPADDRAKLKEQARVDIEREANRVQAARVKAVAASILQTYERRGPDAGNEALQKATQGVSEDIADDIYGKVQTGLSRRREAQQQASADIIRGVHESIASNTADQSTADQVEALWELGALTATERASLSARVTSARMEGAKLNAAAATIRQAVESGTPVDPSNPDVKKALTAAFTRDAQGASAGSESWLGLATAYAARTRALPEPALSWARGALRSPDPKVAAPAAQFVAGVEASAPEAAGQFDATTRAFAAVVNGMIGAGTQPDKAVETARATVYDIRQDVVKQRKDAYREFAKQSDGALTSLIDRDFDSLATSQPGASQALAVDFSAQTGRYFEKTGDIELARELAWRDLTRVYGPSRVNGDPVMMAMPPERFGVTPEVVREEITSFLKDNPQADGSASEEIALVPDSLTLRAVTSALDGQAARPSYKLVTKTGDLVVDKQGIPLRYVLPEGDLGARVRKAQEDAAKAVEQARFDRESRRTQRELINRGEIR